MTEKRDFFFWTAFPVQSMLIDRNLEPGSRKDRGPPVHFFESVSLWTGIVEVGKKPSNGSCISLTENDQETRLLKTYSQRAVWWARYLFRFFWEQFCGGPTSPRLTFAGSAVTAVLLLYGCQDPWDTSQKKNRNKYITLKQGPTRTFAKVPWSSHQLGATSLPVDGRTVGPLQTFS